MSSVKFSMDQVESFDRLQAVMDQMNNPGPLIDKVLHNRGADEIKKNIQLLLPVSGRHWKGKKTAAKSAKPFRQEFDDMSVMTRTIKNYHYLYFPDDGTTTYRHIGFHGVPREFMYGGAENSADKIIDMCIDRIIKELEG